MDNTVGRITQLTDTSNNIKIILPIHKPTKIDLINRLKFYQEDYELTEHDNAMKVVIDWFMNCTPEYVESD